MELLPLANSDVPAYVDRHNVTWPVVLEYRPVPGKNLTKFTYTISTASLGTGQCPVRSVAEESGRVALFSICKGDGCYADANLESTLCRWRKLNGWLACSAQIPLIGLRFLSRRKRRG